jgi:SAM-dependent methyltransferase
VQSAGKTRSDVLNPTGYFLGSSSAELDRLRLQAKIYEEHTCWLLDRIPIQPGWRALDVACGPIGIIPLLAERVGPTGEVIGLDSDERMVENARALVADQRLTNTQIVVGDARRTGLPSSRFDLLHERLLLINVPDPESVLAEMIRLTRPGGVIAVQEVDTVSWLCEPPHPAWDRLLDAWKTIGSNLGKDLFIGRRLPALLEGAGLCDVGAHVHALVYRGSHLYKMHLIWFIELGRDRILELGLFSPRELSELVDGLRRHLEQPSVLVLSHLLFQAWGRRPWVPSPPCQRKFRPLGLEG